MNWQHLLSRQVQTIPPSAIRRFFDLASEMKGEVISLSIGEPDFVTPWQVREAGIRSLELGHTHYSPNAGYLSVRQAISAYLQDQFDLSYCPQEETLVTVGGSEAIDLTVRALVNPGDEVIIAEPSFVAYQACVRLAGGIPVPVHGPADQGFKCSPDQLRQALSPKTKLVILAYPNNPTGAIATAQELAAWAEVLSKQDLVVLSDELYAELTYAPHRHVSIAALPGMRERTVVVNGLSKAFAMTGWRIGYACGPASLIDSMKKIHQYAIMCSPTMAQEAAIEALTGSRKPLEQMREAYDARRRLLLAACRELDLPCTEPLGAFYLFPDIRSSGLSSQAFCERFLQEEKVAIVPGEAFGACAAGFVRISYATSTDNLREALVRLERFVKRCRKHA